MKKVDEVLEEFKSAADELGYEVLPDTEAQKSAETTLRRHSIDPEIYPIRVIKVEASPMLGIYSGKGAPFPMALTQLEEIAKAVTKDVAEVNYSIKPRSVPMTTKVARMVSLGRMDGQIPRDPTEGMDIVVVFAQPN